MVFAGYSLHPRDDSERVDLGQPQNEILQRRALWLGGKSVEI